MSTAMRTVVLLVALFNVNSGLATKSWDFHPPMDKYVPQNRAEKNQPWLFAFFTCKGMAMFRIPAEADWEAAMTKIDAFLLTNHYGKKFVDCLEGKVKAFYNVHQRALIVMNYDRPDNKIRFGKDFFSTENVVNKLNADSYAALFKIYPQWEELKEAKQVYTESTSCYDGIYRPQDVILSKSTMNEAHFLFHECRVLMEGTNNKLTIADNSGNDKMIDDTRIPVWTDSAELKPTLVQFKNGSYFWIEMKYKIEGLHLPDANYPSRYFVRQQQEFELKTAVMLAHGDRLVDPGVSCPPSLVQNLTFYKARCYGIVAVSLDNTASVELKIKRQVRVLEESKQLPCYKGMDHEAVQTIVRLASISANKLAVAMQIGGTVSYAIINLDKANSVYRFSEQNWMKMSYGQIVPFFVYHSKNGDQLCFQEKCVYLNGGKEEDNPHGRNVFVAYDHKIWDQNIESGYPISFLNGNLIKLKTDGLHLISKKLGEYRLLCQLVKMKKDAGILGPTNDIAIDDDALKAVMGLNNNYVTRELQRQANKQSGSITISSVLSSVAILLVCCFI